MKGKVVVITGASSGIGRALAIEYAKRGANVVMAARSIDKLIELSEYLQQFSVETFMVKTDVSIEEDCKLLIAETVKKFNRIDVLINNAGISMRALFENTELLVLKQLIDVNFWGTVYCTKYALPYLLQSKGSVVGVSSIAGYQGLPGRTGYSASKFAMQGFLEVIRIENRKKGLHVLIACPGFTASNIRNVALTADGSSQGETPLDESKLMTAEKVACKIANAVKKRKRILTLTFTGKITILLGKFLPKKWMDAIVYNHMAKETNAPISK